MSSVPVVPARLDWPSVIGNFLLNFGTLEYLVFVFLKDHLPTVEFDKVKEWHFKDRISRIAQHLKDAKYPVEEQTTFVRLAERIVPIREIRNHIAHGHLYLRLDSLTQEPTVTVFRAKDLDTGFLPDSTHVEFPELLAALSTLNELMNDFDRITGFKSAGATAIEHDPMK